jgi:hypothetical protein
LGGLLEQAAEAQSAEPASLGRRLGEAPGRHCGAGATHALLWSPERRHAHAQRHRVSSSLPLPGRRLRPCCCAAARLSRFACVGMALSWSAPPDTSGSTTSRRGAPGGVPPRSPAYHVPFASVGCVRALRWGRTASAAARVDSASQCASIKDLPDCEAHTRPAITAVALPFRPQRERHASGGRACERCNHASQPSAVRWRAWSSNRSVRSKPLFGGTP